MRAFPRQSPRRVDAVAAVALTMLAQVELLLLAERVEGPRLVQHLAFAVMTAAVAWRRSRPATAAILAAAGLAAQTVAGDAPAVGGFLALLVVTASLGFHAPAREAVLGLIALLLAGELYPLVSGDLVVADEIGNLAIFLGAFGLARGVRVTTARAVQAEVTRDRYAREAVDTERRRIARDLHDSVAHAITTMTLQAGGARQLVADPQVCQALRAIEESGRTALADMHRFLGLLRMSPGAADGAPSLDNLPALADRSAAAGLRVELHVEPGCRRVTPSVAATAYRVVQEALTNSLRHARSRHADVRLVLDGDALVVTVDDDGPGTEPGAASPGGGSGLAGLRERVALFAGSLTAGPRPGASGWRLQARIPLDAVPSGVEQASP